MERNRNVALGGPGGLRRLQEEGYLVVVAAMDRLRLRPDPVPVGAAVVSVSAVDARRARIVFRQARLPSPSPSLPVSLSMSLHLPLPLTHRLPRGAPPDAARRYTLRLV